MPPDNARAGSVERTPWIAHLAIFTLGALPSVYFSDVGSEGPWLAYSGWVAFTVPLALLTVVPIIGIAEGVLLAHGRRGAAMTSVFVFAVFAQPFILVSFTRLGAEQRR